MIFVHLTTRKARFLATLGKQWLIHLAGLLAIIGATRSQEPPEQRSSQSIDAEAMKDRIREAERSIDARAEDMSKTRDDARALLRTASLRAWLMARKRARSAQADWLEAVRNLAMLHHTSATMKADYRKLHSSSRYDPVRISWSVLPSWMQPLLTGVSGMPLPGEVPNGITRWSVLHPLSMTIAAVVLFMASPFLLPLSWLLVGSTTRTLDGVGRHHGAHMRLFLSQDRRLMKRYRRWNHMLAETMALLLLAGPIAGYRREHVRDHHDRSKTGTLEDPDTRTLAQEGAIPGITPKAQWTRVLWKTVDPRFYARFWMRIREALDPGVNLGRRTLTTTYLAGLVTMPLWAPKAALLILPGLLIGYPLTVLFEFVSEHLHYRRHGAPAEEVTFGRFFGEALPVTRWGRLRWAVRWPRYLLAKLLIGQADLSSHDLHHLRPGSDWRTAGFVPSGLPHSGCKIHASMGRPHFAQPRSLRPHGPPAGAHRERTPEHGMRSERAATVLTRWA